MCVLSVVRERTALIVSMHGSTMKKKFNLLCRRSATIVTDLYGHIYLLHIVILQSRF